MRHDDRAPSRRSIVVAALAGGLVGGLGRSVEADEVLSADAIRIPVGDAEIGGFRALPARAGPFACVVVLGDEVGMPDWVPAMCRRLAGSGYLAIGVDAWGGEGAPSDDEVFRRLDAAFLLGRNHSGDAGRTALVGFGRGGRAAWLYAARNAALKAAVAWGGAVSGPTSDASPKTPLDVAGQLKAPLLGLYGKDDAANPRDVLLKAEAAGGRRVELIVYDGAAADFGVEGRPTYDRAACLDGWNKMLGWLKRHGVA
jgi:carboxymethylenebutenolidase